ncbi:MAG: MFS transporter [Anaerolineae bacterium]
MSRRTLIFVLFTLAYILSYFFRSANAVIAPELSRDLGLDAAQLGFMTSLFFAAFAAVQLPLGVYLDRIGPRWVTPGLMLIGAVGGLIFASATSFGVSALGRALIGVGMAGILMGALRAFSVWFSPQRFATISGVFVGIGATGALLATRPLALLAAAVGWRSAFVLGAAITAVVAAAIMVWARNAPPGVDWRGGDSAGGSLRTVLADRRFWRIAPLIFFMSGALYAFQGLWAGPYLFDAIGLDKLEGSSILLALALGAVVGFLTSGWLSDRFGVSRVVVTSATILVADQLLLIARPPLAVVTVAFVVYGLTAAPHIMLITQARALFPPALAGRAMSATNLFAIGGTFILQWWMGGIIGLFAADAAGRYPPAAYGAALLFLAVGVSLALLWYLPLARRTRQPVATQ